MGELPAHGRHDSLVGGEAGQEEIPRSPPSEAMGYGQRFAVALHLLGAQQLRAQRCLVGGRRAGREYASQSRIEAGQ